MTHANQTKPLTTHPSRKFWLVGASAGIGLALCEKLLQQGDKVIASSRNAESSTQLLELQKSYQHSLQLLNIDVTKPDTITHACTTAWECFEGIDCWIYNAGSYEPLSIDQWDEELFIQMNQTNYLGAVRMMIALKPYFLEQASGEWLWNISLSSDFGLPYAGAYSAPKAALMNLAESLQPELQHHKIQLKVVNHGFVNTRLTAKNDFPMLGLMEPHAAADKILQTINATGRFETRFPWSLASILSLLKRLPKSWALKLSSKTLKHH
ncbi:SDR family NAD(P)-dependent oxidoreductase [Thiomicrorhabdus indica]|uniref:SDR family NAD(P)-dependent oxidoreductase n=1 Tax=Thiomicrorhabdus indica TaxID=2267253 RepID=UPI002AA5E645|nr:SDR family NAD(P)-dependent oxidoreductase [Thiomicrorhabdus indica]